MQNVNIEPSTVTRQHQQRTSTINLLITTRCNMACAHCCQASTPNGENMPLELLERVISYAARSNYGIHIAGGEPTLHPDFWGFVEKLQQDAATRRYTLAVTTNGSRTETALRLAAMAKSGQLTARLSLTKWHRPIKQQVIDAFCKGKCGSGPDQLAGDLRSCTTGPAVVVNQGRGRRIVEKEREGKTGPFIEYCSSPVRVIFPDGGVAPCSCLDAPILGNVKDFGHFIINRQSCWFGREIYE